MSGLQGQASGATPARNTGGVNTNHVESFLSRIQRACVGIHHRFSVRYFDWYEAEIAWREDNRQSRTASVVVHGSHRHATKDVAERAAIGRCS